MQKTGDYTSEYKTATKFWSNCRQDEPVAYIDFSDEENVSNV